MRSTFEGFDEISQAMRTSKSGDVVLHLEPKGALVSQLRRVGLHAVFGCIDDVNRLDIPSVRLWSTLFAGIADLTDQKSRVFRADEAEIIVLEDAEDYIERESNGRFRYGQMVEAVTTTGVTAATINCYFNGILSTVTLDGEPCIGGASFFTPLDK